MKRIAIGSGIVEWVAKRTGEHGNYGASVGIGLQEMLDDGWHTIAGVVYNDFNGANVNMHVASDGTKRWLNRQFLWTCFDYPFNQLKVKRITGLVGEGNHAAIRFDSHIGFELEARLKDAHPDGDMLIFVLRKPQAQRWLNLRNSHESARTDDFLKVAS